VHERSSSQQSAKGNYYPLKNPVQTFFDNVSARYRQNFSTCKSGRNYQFLKRAELAKALAKNACGSLLDCACGTGEITLNVLKTGKFTNATLVDISGEMLKYSEGLLNAASLGCSIEFNQTDIFKFQPDSNRRFDVILCLGLVAHSGNLSSLLCHLKSMLSSNGIILLQITAADHLGVEIVRLFTSRRYLKRYGYSISYYTISDLQRSCVESGLMVKDIRRYCFGFPFGDRIFALGNYWLERIMRNISSIVGSEAICVLAHHNRK